MTPVHIIAKGVVGVGKGAVLHEIYIALRAMGVPVEYAAAAEAEQEHRMVDVSAELERMLREGLRVVLHEDHAV